MTLKGIRSLRHCFSITRCISARLEKALGDPLSLFFPPLTLDSVAIVTQGISAPSPPSLLASANAMGEDSHAIERRASATFARMSLIRLGTLGE